MAGVGRPGRRARLQSLQPTDGHDRRVHHRDGQRHDAHYALYTFPNSDNVYYRGEWFALKTVGGSAYQLVTRFVFHVVQTVTP